MAAPRRTPRPRRSGGRVGVVEAREEVARAPGLRPLPAARRRRRCPGGRHARSFVARAGVWRGGGGWTPGDRSGERRGGFLGNSFVASNFTCLALWYSEFTRIERISNAFLLLRDF